MKKYSVAADSLEVVGDTLKNCSYFCVCGFIDKLYFIGGRVPGKETARCWYFDTNKCTWGRVASMKEARSSAACTAFEGRIVVSGGTKGGELTTVESYDHIADEWSRMPSMTTGKSYHHLVAVKNKLFSIGFRDFDVYDSTCKKFVSVKTCQNWFVCGAVFVENRIITFEDDRSRCMCYDIDTEEWSVESCTHSADSFNSFTVIPKPTLS